MRSAGAAADRPWNALRACERYMNGGCLSRRDALLSLIAPSLPIRRNAGWLMRQVGADGASGREPLAPERTVPLARYRGSHAAVRKMRSYLQANLAGDLAGAYVLGSLATGEEVAYSDFDALAVVRDAVFEDSRRLARVGVALNRGRSIMLEHDPLQHHGWFVMREAELQRYPEDYLPLDVLAHGKALVPDRDHVLRVRARSGRSGPAPFRRLAAAVLRRARPGARPRTLYSLKGFLSQVMLLPAVYVQARDGRGVFKKQSFELGRADFAAGEWRIMDTVSHVRAEWSQPLSGVRRTLLTTHRAGIRKLANRISPSIPAALARTLDDEFYAAITRLVASMQARVDALADRDRHTSVSAV